MRSIRRISRPAGTLRSRPPPAQPAGPPTFRRALPVGTGARARSLRSFLRPSRAHACLALGATIALLGACHGLDRGPQFLGAGATEPRRGGTLRLATVNDVRSLDPAIGFDQISATAEHLIYSSLVDYDDGTNIVPDLAESWTVSADGKTYRFRLRPGVRFHNGREVTAEDFRYSFERILLPQTGSSGADFFRLIRGAEEVREGRARHVEGLRAIDRSTFEVELVQPDLTFLYIVALPFGAPVPREEIERWGPNYTEHPVGTGPFRLVSWERGERLVFERNRGYYVAGEPYLDRIVFLTSLPRETQFLKFESSELDHLERFTPADYLYVKRNPRWRPQILQAFENSTYGELMNTKRPPFDDVRVRRAINHAINKQTLSRLRNGRIYPARGILPPRVPGYNPELRGYDYDPAKARRLLGEAGYPNGFAVEYATLDDESARMIAESEQHDLRRIGVSVRIRLMNFPAYLSLAGRNALAFGYTGWSQDYPDPSDFLETKFHSRNITAENANNDTNYRNLEVDRRLDEARADTDPGRRLRRYQEIEQLIVDDAPWVFGYHPIQTEILQPWLKGYSIHPVWYRNVRNVWLDLPLKRVEHRRIARLGPRGIFP